MNDGARKMKIINPSIEIITPIDRNYVYKFIERCGRTCYKSEDKISKDGKSAENLIKLLLQNHHEAMLEFFDITVKFVLDIGGQRDLSRHRHISMACESTRYVNYSKEKFGNQLTFIKPLHINNNEIYNIWEQSMRNIENNYMQMAKLGAKPDELRMILPLSTKTEFCIKANIREWIYILKLRTNKNVHPSVRYVMIELLKKFKEELPLLFNHIEIEK